MSTWEDRYDNGDLYPGEPADEGEREDLRDAENDARASELGEKMPE